MAAFTIPSIFTAVDRVTMVTRTIGSSIHTMASRAEADIYRADRSLRRMGNSAENLFNKLNPLRGLSFLGITAGIGGLTLVVKKFIGEAMKIENAVASFTPLTGSAENATRLVKDLNKAAADTPFQFDALASATNMMLGFGVATQANVIDKLKMLGDVAQGNPDKLNGITLAFSQIGAAGKANMQDVNQLINNGVPILGELSKMWGVNVGEARKMVEQGKGTATEIEKAFRRMTGEGGMFYKGMEIATKTLTGQLSTLADNVNLAFGEIGAAAMPILKDFTAKAIQVADGVRQWVSANQDLIKQKVYEWADKFRSVLVFLINNFDTITTAVGFYIKALLLLKAVSIISRVFTLLNAAALIVYKTGLFLFNKEARLATIAQWKLNAAFLANPVTWITLAIIALIVAIGYVIAKTEGWGEQWDAVMTWMKTVFRAFKLYIMLQWQVLALAFHAFVDGVVLAWKWMQNKLGLLSDEQFAKDKARIAEETRLRVQGIRNTTAELAKAAAQAAAGPEWKLRWKTEQDKKGGMMGMFGGLQDQLNGANADMDALNGSSDNPVRPLNPKAAQAKAIQTLNVFGQQKSNTEITIKDETGKAQVTKNPSKIPIKITPSLNGQF